MFVSILDFWLPCGEPIRSRGVRRPTSVVVVVVHRPLAGHVL
jgi:hypothetical protein